MYNICVHSIPRGYIKIHHHRILVGNALFEMCATSHKKPLSPAADGLDYYTIYRGKIQSVSHVALFEMSLMVIDCVCDTLKPVFPLEIAFALATQR